jgi:hypothetical protein
MGTFVFPTTFFSPTFFMFVTRLSGATETDKSNPVPDPALLLAKATSNWLRQHNIDILPMRVDDDDDDSSNDVSDSESESSYGS